MFCKSVVTAVVSRNRHDGACSITCQYVITDPYGNSLAGKRIDGVWATEYTGYAAVGDTFTFRTFLGAVQIGFHFGFLCFGSKLGNQFAFGRQYHEGYTEHGICTGSKDSEFNITVFHFELYFRTFRASNPVTLCFFQWISPVHSVQSVQQPLCVSRYA